MDRVVVDVERVRFRIGKGQGAERRRLEIYDFLAPQAHEMMVTMSLGIEARAGTWAADFDGEPKVHERIEHPIDGGAGDLREARAHLF